MDIDWSVFDKVIYINLKERHDRKNTIKKELRSLGIPPHLIHRVEATRHLVGQIGRARSHLAAVETAISEGWGNVLILEDNMIFDTTAEAKERLNAFLQTLKKIDWHCALLSTRYRKVITLKSTDRIVKPVDAGSACAYAVHRDYRDTMRACFATATGYLLKGGSPHEYALENTWLPLMQQHRWIGMYPVAGHPTPGMSDTEGCVVDHTEHYYKKLSVIAL
ncbi:glycosyl hydrolase family 25 [Enterobacter cloacae complex sp. P24RS]|uniref:glycosyl hydrolase family 25 n=1 Tax=Enterobacter cloacae complex sp. P24RS TaxID=2779568 RepID=UPI001875F4D3|nr:glycosyl hydrolase family 25 [Enterobacter cloacae complex sp. P24RS]MBE4963665.1 glycosyl hydrolase family 25 [Enterobacter cloacae complex sp. P24RS]